MKITISGRRNKNPALLFLLVTFNFVFLPVMFMSSIPVEKGAINCFTCFHTSHAAESPLFILSIRSSIVLLINIFHLSILSEDLSMRSISEYPETLFLSAVAVLIRSTTVSHPALDSSVSNKEASTVKSFLAEVPVSCFPKMSAPSPNVRYATNLAAASFFSE